MPRLIRRKPFLERLKDFLNPGDFWLWISEWIETRDWDGKQYAAPMALGFHAVMMIARANMGASGGGGRGKDDVFGDEYSGSGWLSAIATFFVYLMTIMSGVNAVYTFSRKRPYRLFESSIDTNQTTPSAQRVRVDASPAASSPLRFISTILGDTSAESRAHPDPTRDVWEISIWDPYPINLKLFCLFSPGHVLVYWLFLPTLPLDPRPSVTIFTTLFLEVLLSSQLYLLQSSFSQQEKDTAIIQREVMREYDTKFVHPRLNPLVRDVGTQYSDASTGGDGLVEEEKVDTYTPTVILKRGFRINPNPNYAKHIDPENSTHISRNLFSPGPSFIAADYTSRDSTPAMSGFTPRAAQPPLRQPQFRPSLGGMKSAMSTSAVTASPMGFGGGGGDGGSLGVYSHVNSPLKKAVSMYDMQPSGPPKSSFAMAAQEIRQERERERSRSPTKRASEGLRPSSRHSEVGGGGRASSASVSRHDLLASGHEERGTSARDSWTGMKQKPGTAAGDSGAAYKRGPSRF